MTNETLSDGSPSPLDRAAEILFKANDPEGHSKWVEGGKLPMNPKWRDQAGAVLGAIRDPSRDMIKAADNVRSASFGPEGSNLPIKRWHAMIDAAIVGR